MKEVSLPKEPSVRKRGVEERLDFLELTVNKLWDELYRLQESHYDLKKKVGKV
jgi:hypothetical protein